MGEVLYIWPDPDNNKSQIVISAIVQAMDSMNALGILRFVGRDGGNPRLGFAKPVMYNGEEGRIECMHWVQVRYEHGEGQIFANGVMFTRSCPLQRTKETSFSLP
jgi:hypothetical protein